MVRDAPSHLLDASRSWEHKTITHSNPVNTTIAGIAGWDASAALVTRTVHFNSTAKHTHDLSHSHTPQTHTHTTNTHAPKPSSQANCPTCSPPLIRLRLSSVHAVHAAPRWPEPPPSPIVSTSACMFIVPLVLCLLGCHVVGGRSVVASSVPLGS